MHLGPVASGRLVSRDEACRQQFASRYGVLAFDQELDAAVQSVQGNCRDSFVAIRGISDYRDGSSRRSEWQPYAALAAASVMKAIIMAMDPPNQ
jgi:nucleoside phosphorylase